MPFITIVTRCYKKPLLLHNNIRSLKAQTNSDYEQLFIVDKVGKGLAAADQSLNLFKHFCDGDYVMVLDDDDMLINSSFIDILKQYVYNADIKPDVFIWRGDFPKEGILPRLNNRTWGVRPVRAGIGSFNYAVSNLLYKKYIDRCNSGVTGDFDFIEAVMNNIPKPNTVWIEDVMVKCQTKSRGREE